MENIEYIVKGFFGDIFGEYIVHKYNKDTQQVIDCRIDRHLKPIFINIISINFTIENLFVSSHALTHIQLSCKTTEQKFLIRIWDMTYTSWHLIPNFIDVFLLTENNACIYVRPCFSKGFIHINDKVNHLIKRCHNKQFAFTSPLFGNIDTIVFHLDNAYNMILSDWTMDNIYIKHDTLVINKFDKFDSHSHDICSICHENFTNDQIVIKTSCNHFFHWKCNGSDDNNGLRFWIVSNKNVFCPYCRQIML
jgi:hypothetical protein